MEKKLNVSELKALINLLDDPDSNIYSEIKNKLISYGADVIPVLEDVWGKSEDFVQPRIEEIIHQIYFIQIQKDLKSWVEKKEFNLLDGSVLISRYQYPELNKKRIVNYVEQIRREVWLELNNNLTALEKVKILNHIFYNVYNFSGDNTNIYTPQNSYISNVLETRKGNPISLSVIYAIIAQSLDIPIYGINLPEHFILAYTDKNSILPFLRYSNNNGVLFYVNPFNKGTVFSKNEIDAFLNQLGIEPEEKYYVPCNNLITVRRMVENLIKIYEHHHEARKVKELKILHAILGKVENSETEDIN